MEPAPIPDGSDSPKPEIPYLAILETVQGLSGKLVSMDERLAKIEQMLFHAMELDEESIHDGYYD